MGLAPLPIYEGWRVVGCPLSLICRQGDLPPRVIPVAMSVPVTRFLPRGPARRAGSALALAAPFGFRPLLLSLLLVIGGITILWAGAAEAGRHFLHRGG